MTQQVTSAAIDLVNLNSLKLLIKRKWSIWSREIGKSKTISPVLIKEKLKLLALERKVLMEKFKIYILKNQVSQIIEIE